MPKQRIVFTEEFCQPELLFPFTLCRSLQETRVGILTIREKWEKMMGLTSVDKKQVNYKDSDCHVDFDQLRTGDSWWLLHGNILPTPGLCAAIRSLRNGDCLLDNSGSAIAYRVSKKQVIGSHKVKMQRSLPCQEQVHSLVYPWDILRLNAWALQADFKLLTRGRRSAVVPKGTKVIGRGKLFIEKGATVYPATINTQEGPVYIASGATVMEGSLIRGPVAIGQGACVKMGTRLYGATTVGPFCTVGGEIKHSVFQGYSNKAHDGYLGDAVIGHWCNLGAGTTNSNIKNNASPVKVWTLNGEKEAGQKCGVMMGDFSQTAINTSINTGTVIGLGCNVMGQGLTPSYVPCFSWGQDGIERYRLPELLLAIGRWKQLKGHSLSVYEEKLLHNIYKKF
jgi:UDP-N-acetylglucosamine diphosphorylase / glucose-1-phosphate thymidylyltransferase / UDP-N-acetylgalactosamine diphosphorylase / glucosamine-1-phosphate N-acetyltransferase / galactosamine-1-phosphate N-acetyltransferase